MPSTSTKVTHYSCLPLLLLHRPQNHGRRPFVTRVTKLRGGCLPHPEVVFHAMLVTFSSPLVLRFSTSCYGCHQSALNLGVSQQVSTIYPSKPALCSFWGCLPHPEVQFHAMLVTFLSSLVLCFSTSYLKRPKLKQKTSFNGYERKYNKCQYK